jgi:hypothetical protein
MNHRDHRKPWESSSGFGQIFWRDFGRGAFGAADIDLVIERAAHPLLGRRLVMIFEHKEPVAEIKFSQRSILQCLAAVIDLAVTGGMLDPASGVYTIRGHIAGRTSGHRETYFDGPQVIERMALRPSAHPVESWTVEGQDALFRWIDRRLGFTPKARRWRDANREEA